MEKHSNDTIHSILQWLIATNDGAYIFAALVILGLLACVSAIVGLFWLYKSLYQERIKDRDSFQAILEKNKNAYQEQINKDRTTYQEQIAKDRTEFQNRIFTIETAWYDRYESAKKETLNIQLKNFEVLTGLKEALSLNNKSLDDLVNSLNQIWNSHFHKNNPSIKRMKEKEAEKNENKP